MAWGNPFRRKVKEEEAKPASEPAAQTPAESPVSWPRSAAARKEIEQQAYKERRAAELRASERTALQGIASSEDAYQRALAELTKPENREATALAELINRFVPGSQVELRHKDGDTYVAHQVSAKGRGFAADADNQSVFETLGAEIRGSTDSVSSFIANHMALAGSVLSANSTKSLATSTMVGGTFSRTVYTDTSFAIDREKLKGYSEKIATGQLQRVVDGMGASGFEVRPRGKERNYAIDIRGNDPTVRRKLVEKLDELGVAYNSDLHFGRSDDSGRPLAFDASKGDIRYIRITMPNNFAEQIDMLKDISRMVADVEEKKSVPSSLVAKRIGMDANPDETPNPGSRQRH